MSLPPKKPEAWTSITAASDGANALGLAPNIYPDEFESLGEVPAEITDPVFPEAFRVPQGTGSRNAERPEFERVQESERVLEGTPLFVDVAGILSGTLPEPPLPTVCRREDGAGLFYRGQLNNLFGDPECGKTFIALAAIVEQLALDDGRALFIDADHNGAEQILSRLIELGATVEQLSDPDKFRLADPEDSIHLGGIVEAARNWQPTIAVVDSVGELLPLFGMNSNNSDDYTSVVRRALRPLFRVGAAVVTIDHLAKSPDSRAAGPTGTAAKGRAIGGVSIRVHLREPFVPGKGGCAALSIKKDRPGGLRRVSPVVSGKEQPAGLFILKFFDNRLSWRITTPTEEDVLTNAEVSGRAGTWAVTAADLAELDDLTDEARSSVRKLKEAMGWGGDRATATLAEWRELNNLRAL